MDHLRGSGSEQMPVPPPIIPSKELNEHIHELYKPDGEPAMEILFFHGLQFGYSPDAYLTTWSIRDATNQVWPGTWLADEFPQAHIFSISYDPSIRMTREHGRVDLHNLAENLLQAIVWEDIGQGFGRPVIFVGHCFGGLVIKELCVQADQAHSFESNLEGNQKIGKFLKNMGGAIFYGTPHRGSHLADSAAYFLDGPFLNFLKSLSKESARLEQKFDSVCKKYDIWHRIASVGESQVTSWGPFHGIVVPEASARYGVDFCTVSADHFSLCKPAKKTSNSFQRLIRFIQSIVPKVQEEACFENIQPRVPKAAVGLDQAVEKVREKLQASAKLGISGMGGVGKTTLARALFNRLGPTFDNCCFATEVKRMQGDVEDVKKELWRHMHFGGKRVAGWSQLKGKKLLLVLDDVAHDRHLDVLSNIADDMAPESRFIVTSRDGELLNNLDTVYEVPFLDEKDAKQLFMSYALPGQAVPPLALEYCVDPIVKKCDGLPLTLEVLGKYLKGKKKGEIWEQTLEALDKADNVAGLDEKLWAKLRLSYTGLSTEEEKQMFLDVTTFFSDSNWTLREAYATWNVAYGYELLRWQTLVDRSLVYHCEEDEHIKVHEQLQSLGRKIASDAKKDGKCIRVWKTAEGLKLLQSTDKSADQEIYSLRLIAPPHGEVNIPRSCLRSFKKLQYLDVSLDERAMHIPGWSRWLVIDGAEENETLRSDLVLLRSPTLHFGQVLFDPALLPRLAVLILSPYNLKDMPGSIGQLSALKILSILASELELFPDEIGHLSKLERLILECDRLRTMPASFGDLSSLTYLEFHCCRSLQTLPESFGRLSALQHLYFRNCDSLQSLPKSFTLLSTLQLLEFLSCANLQSLPKSFGRLATLSHLEFHSCNSLHSLSDSFGRLALLKHLNFSQCGSLQSLPNSFGRLSALNHLEFRDCDNLQCLPETFGRLSALQYLAFLRCDNLTSLPASFGRLSLLQHLQFHRCGNLHTLPDSFGELSALQHLQFHSCGNLQTLPESFGRLCILKHLDFYSCTNLETLPDSSGELSSLTHLAFHNCDNLRCLPGSFGQLANLQKLVIINCRKIERLPFSSGQLKALEHLAIYYTALVSIPDWIEGLPSLQILELGFLPYLGESPPWLGDSLRDPTATSWKFFRTADGRFTSVKHGDNLDSEDVLLNWKFTHGFHLHEWLHANAMDKVTVKDYAGAIADMQRALQFLGPDDWSERQFILQERGIIKRHAGDWGGALKDFNLALKGDCRSHGDGLVDGTLALKMHNDENVLDDKALAFKEENDGSDNSDWDDGDNEDDECVHSNDSDDIGGGDHLEDRVDADDSDDGVTYYNCRKHRGYVRYLLGDVDGAREDGKRALKHLERELDDRELSQISSGLGDEYVSYLEFRLPGVEERVARLKEMQETELRVFSANARVMEKVQASDFRGALAEFDAIDASLLGPDIIPIFLLERGVCKRLAGDLVGSLEDLTTALKIVGKTRAANAYNCRKHRGYVKYLLGDLDGARVDGKKAMSIGGPARYCWNDELDVGQRGRLGLDAVKFLEFELQ